MKPYEIYSATKVIPNCTSLMQKTLAKLFQCQPLWEERTERAVKYRNARWFTLGTPLYLDLPSKESYAAYREKTEYFNRILTTTFFDFTLEVGVAVATALGKSHVPLSAMMPVSYPGFHIFPPHETMGHFFGKWHQDLQYRVLPKMPGWPFDQLLGSANDIIVDEKLETYSFTMMLQMPYGGAALDCRETAGIQWTHEYELGALVIHHGRFDHAIAPFRSPVLPFDWRISIQGHAILHEDTVYTYW